MIPQLSDEQWRFFRYLIVGGWNTAFGIGIYTLLYWLWGQRVHYLLLTIPSNVLAITNAYICYKLFVFRTKGNILREYFRCYIVYGSGTLIGLVQLTLLVELFNLHPVLANIVGTGIIIVFSYLGHKYFSFRK